LASLGHPSKFQQVSRLGSVTARHSSGGREPDFTALRYVSECLYSLCAWLFGICILVATRHDGSTRQLLKFEVLALQLFIGTLKKLSKQLVGFFKMSELF